VIYDIYEGGPLHGRWDKAPKDQAGEDHEPYDYPMAGPGGLMKFTYHAASVRIYNDFTTRLWTMTPESTTRWHEQKERLM
jgi:hypothetical protein